MMVDLDLEGKPRPDGYKVKEDKDAKHTKHTEVKQIKPPDMVGTEFKVEFGNVQRTVIVMLQYVNMNLVELTRVIKLLVPEDKLKKYEEDARGRSGKQG